MMRALVLTELASDYRGCQLIDIAKPVAEEGEVLVRIAASALGFPNLLMTEGGYQHKPRLPHVLGSEIAGEIVACGDGVLDFVAGDRVVGGALGGGFAEYGVYPAARLRLLPSEMSFATGAALGSAYLTAYVALVLRAGLSSGEWLLVHGAAGGVGLAAVDLGCHLGARVIACSASDVKLDAIGALHENVHLLNVGGGFYEAVRTLTGTGADVVYDPVGGDIFDESMRALGWGGRLLVVGFTSGRIATLPTNRALIKGLSILGVRAGEHGRRDPVAGAAALETIWALAGSGDIRPHVCAQVALADWRDAFAMMATRQVVGRVIICPQG